MAKKKAAKKAKKKVNRKKKISRGELPKEPYWMAGRRKRLKLAKFMKEKGLDELDLAVCDFDQKLLADKKADIKRRKKIFTRGSDFAHVLKAHYGRRVRVKFRFDDEVDELHMLVYFKPKQHEHPMDADETITEAFKIAGLAELMDHIGSGTYLPTMERDNHFMEIKPKVKR